MNSKLANWLLDSDPAIRWQVMKEIQDQPEFIYNQERSKLSSTGWAGELLGKQGSDGLWNGSIYNDKWISAIYTLYLLKI